MHRALCTATLIGLALAPTAIASQEADASRRLQPTEVNAAQIASQWVLGAQQQERAIAGALDAGDLAQEIARLRRAVQALRNAERAAGLQDELSGARTEDVESKATALAATRRVRRQEVLDGANRLASQRAALDSRLADIASTRQRRVAQGVIAKLTALEHALREALDAPAGERAGRLAALQRRLTIEEVQRDSPSRPPDRTPTIQVLRRSQLPPLQAVEGTR